MARGPLHWYDMTYDGTWLWEGTELNMPVLDRLYQAVDELTLAQGDITTPVLIVHGRYDYGSPYTLWEKHARAVPPYLRAVRQERPYSAARGAGRSTRRSLPGSVTSMLNE